MAWRYFTHDKGRKIPVSPIIRQLTKYFIEANNYTISQVDRCAQCGWRPLLYTFTCKCGARFIHYNYPRYCVSCKKPWIKIKCGRCGFVNERVYVDGIGEVFLGPQKKIDYTNPLYWLAHPKRGINIYI